MRKPEENDLDSRRRAAAEAKTALLQAHRMARKAAEPTRLERQKERLELATARDARRAGRNQAKLAERERIQVEAAKVQAAADVAAKAMAAASKKASDDQVSRVVEDEAARKTERDRRYAERKAKKR